MAKTSYAIALGSNRYHGAYGAPARVIAAAAAALAEYGVVECSSPVRATPAMGPAGRGFANAALILRTTLSPDALIGRLKAMERAFGRRPGRTWGPRVLDLDIILWSQGAYADGSLVVPHREFRGRGFVLDPLVHIAPNWRDPISGLTVRHLHYRQKMPRPVDRKGPRS